MKVSANTRAAVALCALLLSAGTGLAAEAGAAPEPGMRLASALSPGSRALLVAVPASANVAAPAATLARAVEDALTLSAEVDTAEAEQRGASARHDQARSAMGPALRLRYGFGRDDFENTSRPQGAIVNQRQVLVSLSQTLYDGLAGYNRVKQGEEEMTQAEGRLQLAREATAARISKVYLNVLRHRALLTRFEANLRLHRDYEQRLQRLLQAGTARSTDLELVQGRVAQAELERLKARSDLAEAEQLYRLFVGHAPGALAEPSRIGWPQARGLDEAIAQARQNSAERRALEAAERAAGYALSVARAALGPVVSLEAAHSDREDIDGVDNGFRDERSQRLQLNVDIAFRSGLEFARIREARAAQEAARAKLQASDESLSAEVISAWTKLDGIREQLARYRERLARAQRVRLGFESQFTAGLRSVIDLLGAAAEENSAEAGLLSSTYDEAISASELLAREGRLLRTLRIASAPEPELELESGVP